MDLANAVGDNGEDSGETAELRRLSGGETDGETVDGAVVGVEDLGRAVGE